MLRIVRVRHTRFFITLKRFNLDNDVLEEHRLIKYLSTLYLGVLKILDNSFNREETLSLVINRGYFYLQG